MQNIQITIDYFGDMIKATIVGISQSRKAYRLKKQDDKGTKHCYVPKDIFDKNIVQSPLLGKTIKISTNNHLYWLKLKWSI